MKKIIILLLPIILIGCEGIGSKKVKSIVELTPKLTKESNESIKIQAIIGDLYRKNISKLPSYTITNDTIIARPTFVDSKGVFFITNDKGKVLAFSQKENKMLWVQDISSKGQKHYSGGGIIFHDGKLYITNGSKTLTALDSTTGHELFRKQFPDIIKVSPIMLNSDVVLIQTISNNIIAYNTKTSSIAWQHDGTIETISSTNEVNPIIYDNHVISSYSSGQLFALNIITGREKWVVNLSKQQDVSLASFEPTTLSSLILEDHYIYAVSSAGKIMKIDLISGNVAWELDAQDIQSMSLNGNSLLVTNNARQIAAINTENGKVAAVTDIMLNAKNTKQAITFMPTIVSKIDRDMVLNIIASNGKMYNFKIVDGHELEPLSIINIPTNIQYSGILPCGSLYIFTNKKFMLIGN